MTDKSVPAATNEQVEWWQGRELGEIPEGYGSGEFIDALIVLVEQEQATYETSLDAIEWDGKKIHEQKTTIERLEGMQRGCTRNHVHVDRLCARCQVKFRAALESKGEANAGNTS